MLAVRNMNGLCQCGCGRMRNAHYPTCCPDCIIDGNHTIRCNQRNHQAISKQYLTCGPSSFQTIPVFNSKPKTKKAVSTPHVIIGARCGPNSWSITPIGFRYGNTRQPHIDTKGVQPSQQQFDVGEAYVGGKGSKAIMRDLIDQSGENTGYHVTVYYENGQRTAHHQLKNFS